MEQSRIFAGVVEGLRLRTAAPAELRRPAIVRVGVDLFVDAGDNFGNPFVIEMSDFPAVPKSIGGFQRIVL